MKHKTYNHWKVNIYVKEVEDRFPPAEVAIVTNPPNVPWVVGVPKDVFAVTFVPAEKRESVSVAVPSLAIKLPKSILIVPEPTDVVGKVNPENSKVWAVANADILISELNTLALLTSVAVRVVFVLPLDVLNLEIL